MRSARALRSPPGWPCARRSTRQRPGAAGGPGALPGSSRPRDGRQGSMKFRRNTCHTPRSRPALTPHVHAQLARPSSSAHAWPPHAHARRATRSRPPGHTLTPSRPHTLTPSHAHALTRSRLDAHALTRSRLDAHATASRPHALTPRISRIHAHRHSNVSYAQTFWSDLRRRRHAGDAQATGPAALLLVGGYCGAGAWLGAGSSGQDEAVPNQVLKPDVPPSTCSVAASVLPPAKAMLTSCHELPVGCLGTQQPACL